MAKYQTLDEFMLAPFGHKSNVEKDRTYQTKYLQAVSTGGIKVHAVCKVEESYYVHVKVPSESRKGYFYDVVIRFFSDDPTQIKMDNVFGYKMQFYSNSPSFMYGYAYYYNRNDYLIKALYEKTDTDYINQPPKDANKMTVMGYDKSIYFACRFLSETKFRTLIKGGALKSKRRTSSRFFREIGDFRSVKFDQAIHNEEKKLEKELKKGNRNYVSTSIGSQKIKPGNTTFKGEATAHITVRKKMDGKAHIVTKKKPGKTTRKKT